MKLIISSFSLAILLSSCITPPDIPACRPLIAKQVKKKDAFGVERTEIRPNPKCMKETGDPECGYCVWTITDKQVFVGESGKFRLYKKPWSVLRTESVLVPSEAYGQVKSYIIKNCEKQQDCAAGISKWRVKLDSLDSVGANLPGGDNDPDR